MYKAHRTLNLTLFSPAKVNLFFRVLYKRQDGYHEIASLFQAIDLGDFLSIAWSEEDQLTCSDESIPVDERNLVSRALEVFRQATRCTRPVRCHIKKHIPHSAGLGGGSSNATTMLYGMNRLLGDPLTLKQLLDLASVLGSDTPFFLSRGAAYCTGRGDVVENVSYPADVILPSGNTWIAMPPTVSSTPSVYSMCRPDLLEIREPRLALTALQQGERKFFNDLETPAFSLAPDLLKWKTMLLDAGFSHVTMTGSGAAFLCIGMPPPHGLDPFSLFPVQPLFRSAAEWYHPT